MIAISRFVCITLFWASTAMADDANPAEVDPFLWLEEVEGARALGYVEGLNAASLPRLESQPGFEDAQVKILDELNAPDRIAYGVFRGGMVYNFWQDETNVRGLIRRSPEDGYLSGNPVWESVLDIDALAEAEGENWVYKGLTCLGPQERLCMISLSPGGTDAVRLREFDLEEKAFVDGGFDVPVAKTWFDWVDAQHLLIGTDFGEGSVTESGYPRSQRLWKRGTHLADAPEVFATEPVHMGLSVASKHTSTGSRTYLSNILTFWTSQTRVFEPGKPPSLLPLPEDANIVHYGVEHIFALMRSQWGPFPAGSLVALNVPDALAGGTGTPELVFAPSAAQAIEQVSVTSDAVYVVVLEDVSGQLLRLTRGKEGRWDSKPAALPTAGTIAIIDADEARDRLFVQFESFTQPETLFLIDGGMVTQVDAIPERFDASKIVTEQRFAASADGTKVPYYVVRPKKLPKRKPAPVWLYGYGGFEIAVTPFYLSAKYQLWLEQGGVFVIGNIRGGGEYGPAWHQAALLENRHKAYEDFAAIADDLVKKGLTDAAHVGVAGGSNGGLLTGVMLTRYPEKINAAIIGVPLSDMLRYDKLLAGASWVGEYGDPDEPDMRAYLEGYSPYHNIYAEKDLPEAFIFTSTKDDRVHPGHARKLAARLAQAGQPFMYYENTEGGHSGAANRKQSAYRGALELAYMKRRLMLE
ncbi:MAG: prolyl oligopeptidase family serine peptidase [Pseudomonadota bacterium]